MTSKLPIVPSLLAALLAHFPIAQLSGSSRAHEGACSDISRSYEAVDLASFFDGMDAALVVWQPHAERTIVFNRSRAARRFIPASTFKIPNSVIALETGVVSDASFSLPWDSRKTPPEDWWPSSWRKAQSLESAFQNSVYWFYQELARRIGEQQMSRYLKVFQYGNQDVSGGVDQFWLHGGMRISPFEQVEFLERLYSGRLGVSIRTIDILKRIMTIENNQEYVLVGKTGTANVTPTRELGWLVGFVETPEGRSYYALNIEGERVWEDWPPQERVDLLHRLLAELGILPRQESATPISRQQIASPKRLSGGI